MMDNSLKQEDSESWDEWCQRVDKAERAAKLRNEERRKKKLKARAKRKRTGR